MRNQTGTDELHIFNGPEIFPVIALGWTEKKAVKMCVGLTRKTKAIK